MRRKEEDDFVPDEEVHISRAEARKRFRELSREQREQFYKQTGKGFKSRKSPRAKKPKGDK